MEAFSLLKYWKGGAVPTAGVGGVKPKLDAVTSTTTIVAAVRDDDNDSISGGDGDDGPFFDLEFAVPDDDVEGGAGDKVELRQKVEKRDCVSVINEIAEVAEDDDDGEAVMQGLSFSPPSDDLFFKGRFVQIDGGSDGGSGEAEDDLTVKLSSKPGGQLVKSAAKLRVFMLGLKRSKSESKQTSSENHGHCNRKNDSSCDNNSSKNESGNIAGNSKFMTVKLRLEDVKGPIVSLLSRASSNSKFKNNGHNNGDYNSKDINCKNSNNNNNNNNNNGSEKSEDRETVRVTEECGGENEKRNTKEVVQKYLKLVKMPRKSGLEAATPPEERKRAVEVAAAGGGGGRRQRLSLKAVIAKKHLGKSKSAVVHSMPNHNSNNNNSDNTASSKKRDDSLLQQQDGIQSAILHCKRSFNSSSASSQDGEDTTSVLTRSASEPLHEKNAAVTAAVEVVVLQTKEPDGVVVEE